MKTVLFITSALPDVAGAGKAKRAHQWLTLLQKKYTVEILLVQNKITANHNGVVRTPKAAVRVPTNHLNGIFTTHLTRTPKSKISVIINILFSASRLKYLYSLFVPDWFSLNKKQQISLNNWYGNKEYEKIICFRLTHAELALYIQSITQTKNTELDTDDIESLTWGSISGLYYQTGQYKKWLRTGIIGQQFARLEAFYLKQFDKIYICSANDQKILSEKFPDKEIQILTNKLNPVQESIDSCFSKNLLFVGSLSYYPNEEAVVWFAEKVLPLLRERDTGWCFNVVGYSPSQTLKHKLQQIKGLILHQNLPLINEAYINSSIVVAPLHAGGGTKLKIIEAMLYQRPVIATYEAVRGLELHQGAHYLASETANEFAENILSLYQNNKQYQNLVQQAYSYARDQYCYSSKTDKPCINETINRS